MPIKGFLEAWAQKSVTGGMMLVLFVDQVALGCRARHLLLVNGESDRYRCSSVFCAWRFSVSCCACHVPHSSQFWCPPSFQRLLAHANFEKIVPYQPQYGCAMQEATLLAGSSFFIRPCSIRCTIQSCETCSTAPQPYQKTRSCEVESSL